MEFFQATIVQIVKILRQSERQFLVVKSELYALKIYHGKK